MRLASTVAVSIQKSTHKAHIHQGSCFEESEGPRSRSIGVDPKITATDGDGNSLRYTSRQWLFESKEILEREKEKKKREISELEADLSKFDRQTMDPAEYSVSGPEAKNRRTHQFFLSAG